MESPVITMTLNDEEVKPAPHKIQGIGAGFVPKNLDLDLVDQVECVSSDEALKWGEGWLKRRAFLPGFHVAQRLV